MKLIEAGQSHGIGNYGILEGVPYGLHIDENFINYYLKLRQGGSGRSSRQQLENDIVEIVAGVRGEKCIGTVAFSVKNKDNSLVTDNLQPISKVRPNHADYAGSVKYNETDIRNILESSSARNTTSLVVGGSIARLMLKELGVEIAGFVRSVGEIVADSDLFDNALLSKQNKLYMLGCQAKACDYIKQLRDAGDTCGGTVKIFVRGMKVGVGNPFIRSEKLQSVLAGKVFSVQAVKSFGIGDGFELGSKVGSKSIDKFTFSNGQITRQSNHMGGIEGGMTNGQDIVLTVGMKAIPTLKLNGGQFDLQTKTQYNGDSIRSDVTAIDSFLIVIESVVALALAEVITKEMGDTTMCQLVDRWNKI